MKRQLFATCLCALLVLAACPTWSANGNIGIFADADMTICRQTIPCESGPTMDLYVYALLQGASASGITGAEYSIAVGPDKNADALTFLEFFEPATIIHGAALNPGDPGERGVNIAYASCNTGDGVKVLLERIQVFGDCGSSEVHMEVIKHDLQSNDLFICPLFTLCDAPVFTKVCLGSDVILATCPFPPFPPSCTSSTSGEFLINPESGSECTVAVETLTWSGVKELYSN